MYHKIPNLYKRSEGDHKVNPEFREPWMDYLALNDWFFTEKVDGTNIRIIWDGHKIRFGGRTENADIPGGVVMRLTELFLGKDKEEIFEQRFGETPVTLYGEGFGGKIQSGSKYSKTQDFVLFDVKIGKWFVGRELLQEYADLFKLNIVPIVGKGTLHFGVDMIREGLTSNWGDFPAEGIVAKPVVEMQTPFGDRCILKILTGGLPS